MAGRIPRAFIDELVTRFDIVDIVDSRVKLKKKGKNFSACCPFHNEKTPSFSVSQEKQFYHCFGCGEHGNVIDFVMTFDRLDFVETIEELAGQLGLEIPRENSFGHEHAPAQNKEQKRHLYDLMGHIAQFFQQHLHSGQHQIAVDYLHQRGLSSDIVQKFGIGYVPDEWDQVRNKFGQHPQAQTDLVNTGMLIENEQGRRYDRFRGRLMFPIRDRRGRVIGFGGRVITDGTPKYLNSPETQIFFKGRELYGFYEVLQSHREPREILVVEGYMDVVALAQYGVDYAVASLGTATTAEHMQLLFRQTSTVICCYDGDRAGREAAWRAMEQSLPYLNDGRQIKFIFLPDGEDPDTMVRKEGKAAFEQRLSQAMPLSNFMLNNLIEKIDSSSHEGRLKLVGLAAPLIERIPQQGLRQHLNEKLGERIGINQEHRLQAMLSKHHQGQARPAFQEIKRTPMRVLIALLLQHPEFAQEVPPLELSHEIKIPGLSLFTEILDLCNRRPNITTGHILEYWRDTEQSKLLAKLASWDLHIDEENNFDVFADSLGKIINQCVEQQINNLQAKDRDVGLSTDERRELWQLLQSRPV